MIIKAFCFVIEDPKHLIFRYKLNAAPAADINVHGIVLYEEMVVIDKIGNELVIYKKYIHDAIV